MTNAPANFAKVYRIDEASGGALIRFRRGDFYWLRDNQLLTGVFQKPASPSVQQRLLPLAVAAWKAHVGAGD